MFSWRAAGVDADVGNIGSEGRNADIGPDEFRVPQVGRRRRAPRSCRCLAHPRLRQNAAKKPCNMGCTSGAFPLPPTCSTGHARLGLKVAS